MTKVNTRQSVQRFTYWATSLADHIPVMFWFIVKNGEHSATAKYAMVLACNRVNNFGF